jgi:hypothetical protein
MLILIQIKYLRVEDEIIDLVKDQQSRDQGGGYRGGRGGAQRGDHRGGGDRGRGRGGARGRGRGRGGSWEVGWIFGVWRMGWGSERFFGMKLWSEIMKELC